MKRIFLSCFLLLSSCTLHPPYQRPFVEAPCDWRLESNDISTEVNANWWVEFQDPVLDALIGEALHNNLNLQIAVFRVLEYRARVDQVRAELLPKFDLTGGANRTQLSLETNQVTPGSLRITSIFDFLANVSYELDIWGRIRSATEASFADFFAQIENRRAVVLSLVSAVAEAYIQLRQYDKQLAISRQTLQSRLESFRLAEARFQGGLTSELEVTQAASEMETAAAQVKEFEILVPQQENLLSLLVGRNPGEIERGDTLDTLQMPPFIPEGLPSELLEQRPDIRQAEQALVAANARIGQARALFFPQITLTGFYGGESLQLKDLFTDPARTWLYGFNFMQLLFDAGKTSAKVEEVMALKCEAYYNYLYTIQTAFKEVNDALILNRKSLELVDVQRRRVEILSASLRLATLQYDNGQTDYLNVLDAQRNLFAAQLDYVAAQGESFLSVVGLYKVLGGGWVLDADSTVVWR